MFELIKIFVEQVFKAIDLDKIVAARKNGQMAEIGVGLFGMYSALNSIYITGIRIATKIEDSIRQYERDLNRGGIAIFSTHEIEEELKQQAINIVEFGHSFYAVAKQFEIVDPKSMRELGMFLTGKQNIIRELLRELEGFSRDDPGKVFVVAYEQKLIEAAEIARSESGEHRRNESILQQVGLEQSRPTWAGHKHGAEVLREYLTRRRPLEQMKSLEAILDRLHASLVENFEIKDILVRSGFQAPKDEGRGWFSLSIPTPDRDRRESDEFMAGFYRSTLDGRIGRADDQGDETT